MIAKIISKIKQYTAVLFRNKINEKMRERLHRTDFSIISSNCIGGIVSHDLGLMFKSPTINLYFDAEDFVKFTERLDYYLNTPLSLQFIHKNGYPVCSLDDLTIFFVHYITLRNV